MIERVKIASVGDNCIDIYIGNKSASYAGGNAVNVAVAVQRSGINCSYIGMVGRDEYGIKIKEALRAENVDVSHVYDLAGPTAWTKIKLKDDDRIPVSEDIGIQRNFDLSDADYQFIKTHDFTHYSGFTNWPSAYGGGIQNYYSMVKRHLEQFAKDGILLSIDYSDQEMTRLLEICKNKVEIGFFSRSSATDLEIKDEAKKLLSYGFKLVVLTRGKKGSCVYDGRDFCFQEIIPVVLVDPLGAGDGFIGSFISCYIQKLPLKKCLFLAASYASEVCTKFGGF
jgi:fructoselysine 6-kinase